MEIASKDNTILPESNCCDGYCKILKAWSQADNPLSNEIAFFRNIFDAKR